MSTTHKCFFVHAMLRGQRESPQCNNILLFHSHAFVRLFLVYLFYVLLEVGRHYFFLQLYFVCISVKSKVSAFLKKRFKAISPFTWIFENEVCSRSVFGCSGTALRANGILIACSWNVVDTGHYSTVGAVQLNFESAECHTFAVGEGWREAVDGRFIFNDYIIGMEFNRIGSVT